MVKEKFVKCNAIMFKASEFLNTEALRTLYCSLFLPYINYCSEVWGITYKKSIDCIIKVQKQAIRIISKVNRREHTNELFCKLKLMKFRDLVDFKVTVMMYHANLKLLPANVQPKFTSNIYNCYTLRSKNKFKVNRARTTIKSICLSIYGVRLFNSLPENIIAAKSLFCFKCLYKKYTS